MAYDDIAAGNLILASETREALDERAYGLLQRARRTSNSSTANSTTPVSVLRLDDLPIIGGRAYLIQTSSLVLHSSTANDVTRAALYFTTDGSTPTSSSTLLAITQKTVAATANPPTSIISMMYFPTVNETLSLLLTVSRQAGAGNADILAGTGFPIDIYVHDMGVDPGDTGVDL